MSRRVTRSAARSALAERETNVFLAAADSTTTPSHNTGKKVADSTTTPSRKTGKKVTLQTPGSRKSGAATPCSRLKKKAKLALTPRSAGGTPEDCTICMDKSGTEGGRVTLGCSHHFCRECLATHAARQVRHDQPPSCPLCKGQLTEAEVEQCGPAREMKEESEDEDGGEQEVLVIMEFEAGDDCGPGGEPGFWLMFDPGEASDDEEEEEDSGDEGGWVSGSVSGSEDDIDREAGAEAGAAAGAEAGAAAEAEEAFPLSSIDLGNVDDKEEGEPTATASQAAYDADDDADDDPRPYGGWRWSASHHAWVGNVSVTREPPSGPPEAYDGPDPLAGRGIQGVIAVSASLGGGEEEEGEEEEEAEDGAAEEADPASTRALTRATRSMTLNSHPA